MRNRTWTDDQFRVAVADSISIADTLRKLGLVPKGGNYRTINALVRRMKLDTSHWLGKASGRGKTRILPMVPLEEVLVENSEYSRTSLKARMLQEGMLKNECCECGQKPEWKGKPLVMVLDHINGVSNDHRRENIRLLCPNCNSQQDTFCGRKNAGKKMISHDSKCERCGDVVGLGARWCVRCGRIRTRKVERPSLAVLLEEKKTMNMESMGRKYGVSGNAIRKWIFWAQKI
jgi:hypothetical protein